MPSDLQVLRIDRCHHHVEHTVSATISKCLDFCGVYCDIGTLRCCGPPWPEAAQARRYILSLEPSNKVFRKAERRKFVS